MTLLLSRPRFSTRRRRRDQRGLAQFRRDETARLKTEVEPFRTSLTIGCHLIGWFKNEPLDEVIAHLVQSAADPRYMATWPWPRCCAAWPWTVGEDVAVWRGGRLLALITLRRDGQADVRRFDS
jgi:hypothetical protein